MYKLIGVDPADTVVMQVTLKVRGMPGTRLIDQKRQSKDQRFGYEGDWIGFGGNGIQFTADVEVWSKSGNIDFDIGFVQTLTSNITVAKYKGEHEERSVRFLHKTLPVRDGGLGDIWFKPDAVLKSLQDESGSVQAGDEVKALFPVTHPRKPLPINSVVIQRSFITALVVRVRTTRVAGDKLTPKTLFLDRVAWKCEYSGSRQDANGSIDTEAGWSPKPGSQAFYTVFPQQIALADSAKPGGFTLDGGVANGTEEVDY